MIDLDEIEARASNANLKECKYLSTYELKEILSKLRQAEKDAKRYRWLRDCALRNHIHSLIMVHPDEWDLFNDEEMKCK